MLAPLLAVVLAMSARPLPVVDTCAECRADDAGVTLCEPHAEAERAAMELLEDDIEEDDVAIAVAALKALADLTAAHENAPSERVAAALARGLEHDDASVRLYALGRLASGQHFAATSSALSDAVRGFSRESAALRRAYETELARYEKKQDRRKPWGDMSEQERFDAMNQNRELAGFKNDAWRKYSTHALFGLTLADVLAKRDDAGVDALIRLCDGIDERDFGRLRQVSALLLQARQDAVKRAVEFLEAWHAEQQGHEKELAIAERDYAKAEKKVGNSPHAGTALVSVRLRVDLWRSEVEVGEKHGRKLHDAFATMVEARGLGEAPEWDGKPHAAWGAWLRRHQSDLPRQLDPPPGSE